MQLHPPVEERDEIGQELPIYGKNGDLLRAVDALPLEAAEERAGLLMGIDNHPVRSLRGLVEARGIGRADLDPELDVPGGITDPESGLVAVRESLREGDPVLVFQTVGEDARPEKLLGLGGMEGGADGERLVDAAVRIRQLDVEVVDRGSQGHGGAE